MSEEQRTASAFAKVKPVILSQREAFFSMSLLTAHCIGDRSHKTARRCGGWGDACRKSFRTGRRRDLEQGISRNQSKFLSGGSGTSITLLILSSIELSLSSDKVAVSVAEAIALESPGGKTSQGLFDGVVSA